MLIRDHDEVLDSPETAAGSAAVLPNPAKPGGNGKAAAAPDSGASDQDEAGAAKRTTTAARVLPPKDPVSMLAADVMSSPAIVASANDPVRSVARRMLDGGVHAMPVVDAAGAPVGMVSDGDLLGRRDEGRAWWLEILAAGSPEAAGYPRPQIDRPVGEVMSSPLITIAPTASIRDVAETLEAYHIKRLPVVKKGALVGVVSRTDLVRLAKSIPRAKRPEGGGNALLDFLESMVGGASLRGGLERPAEKSQQEPSNAKKEPAAADLSAAALRQKVQAYKARIVNERQSSKEQAQAERERQVKELLNQHVSDDLWRELLQRAEAAASNGEHEFLLLRFPADLCSDGGRKIDVAEEGWEETLRGEAAELYARWRMELKPKKIGCAARILSYTEDGIIGDLGLFMSWGE